MLEPKEHYLNTDRAKPEPATETAATSSQPNQERARPGPTAGQTEARKEASQGDIVQQRYSNSVDMGTARGTGKSV